jgi:fused signal recognition particle receptor
MFKFLKDKLKSAVSKFSKKVEADEKPEEEAAEIQKGPIESREDEKPADTTPVQKGTEPIPIQKLKYEPIKGKKTIQETRIEKEQKEIPEKKEIPGQIQEKPIKAETSEKINGPIETKEAIFADETIKEEEKVEEVKKGFFSKLREKISTTKISYEKFEALFSDLELILMENNVAVEVIDKIKKDLTQNLVEKPIKRTKVESAIKESLKNSIEDLFNVDKINLLRNVKNKVEKPFVIAFFGINGSGKTTSIAKVANLLKENNISCVLAASDTFRAASIEQLQHHADKLGLKMIKHDYGSDPAAVAFDAIQHAKAKNIDAVLVDTAGRLHSQDNLMQEMEKIIRVAKPDLKIFVGEAITGNDCVEQARTFNEIVGIDGLILTKADVDEKGGAAVSVSYITKKPIIYLGVGQEYKDLRAFEPRIVVEGLGLSE